MFLNVFFHILERTHCDYEVSHSRAIGFLLLKFVPLLYVSYYIYDIVWRTNQACQQPFDFKQGNTTLAHSSDNCEKPVLRAPGRPRSEATRRTILDTVVRLIGQHEYRTVSIDRIAADAKVGKQSIYRWWGSKADLVLEAYTDHSLSGMPPIRKSQDAFADLEADLERFFAFMSDSQIAKGVRSLIAEAQLDEDFRKKLYENVHRVRCEALRRIFRHGYELGQFRSDLDENALAHVIHGSFWYRFLSGTKYKYDKAYAKNIVSLLRPALERKD